MGGLSLTNGANDKPCVHECRVDDTIVFAHHLKSFLERRTVVLDAHAPVEVVGQDAVHVLERQVAPLSLFHHPYAPIHVSGIAVVGVVIHGTNYFGEGVETLVANQHALAEGAPRELFGRTQPTMANEVPVLVNDVGVTIKYGGECFGFVYFCRHHL